MKYEKPEVVTFGAAIVVVKNTAKAFSGMTDSNPAPKNHNTQNAYEADE